MKIVDGNKIVKTSRYMTVFNLEQGVEMLTGINGYSDPFYLQMPSLLDVGIMGSCINNCKICYQGSKQESNMKIEDYKCIVDQCKNYTNQIALGGRGDPNKHENFKEILQYTRENYIVPNYTTSGISLTDEEIQTSKQYCGAVAVSMYNKPFTFDALTRLINGGVKTNIHWVISKETYPDIIKVLEGKDIWNGVFPLDKINAIIFLLFKPKGNGAKFEDLQVDSNQIQNIINKMREAKTPWKIGADSCTVRFFRNMSKKEKVFSDFCEAGRMSAYITPDMRMKPCSFMDDDLAIKVEQDFGVSNVWKNSGVFWNTRKKLVNNSRCCPAIE
jgi:MoaA/NifB/PqqE/SkfB family radical SAM enzyme